MIPKRPPVPELARILKVPVGELAPLSWRSLSIRWRRHLGVCSDCPAPVLPGYVRCRRHLGYIRLYGEVTMAVRRAIGACIWCGADSEDGRMTCRRHRNGCRREETPAITRSKRSRLGKKAMGICYDCSEPAGPKASRCAVHAEAHRLRSRKCKQSS